METSSESGGATGIDTDGESFTNIEYLEDKLANFEDSIDPLDDGTSDGFQEGQDEPGTSTERTANIGKSQINITINRSATEFKDVQYPFTGAVFVRSFKTQHLPEIADTVNIFGNSVEEVLNCIWKNVERHVSREIIVEILDEQKLVKWSPKQSPDRTDLNKFVLLKHAKTKKLYTVEDIQENTKLLTGWREKEIQVHVFKYSVSITSLSVWEVANKQLLNAGKKDRAGAPSTEELFECVTQMKEIHSHYTALWSSWEKWANYILAQPADQRDKLLYEAPPDDYLHLFRAPPVSEGSHLQVTRQGLKVAYNMNDHLFATVNDLCEKVDSLAKLASTIQIQIHEMKAEISSSRSLLDAMATSLPPEETEFSRKLVSRVADLEDIDHQD